MANVLLGNVVARIGAFILALAVAYLIGTATYGQLNLANHVEMGMPVDAAVRWATFWHDFTHMYDLYLILLAIALLIGFSVATLILKWVPQLRTLGYVSSGFVAVFVLDYLLGAVLTSGTHPLGVTRTTVGLLSQCLAGAVAGWVMVQALDKFKK